MERKDRLPGGKADKSSPSDFDPKQLAMGVEVEMEHTDDPDLALEIAMDHLKEDPRYYTKLRRVHKEANMDVNYFLGILEEIRHELWEAAPPPHKAAERQKAGLRPLPTRKGAQPPPIPMKAKRKGVDPKSDVGQALSTVKKLSQTAGEKKQEPKPSKRDMVQKAMSKPQGAYPKNRFGTKGMGISRKMSGGGAGGELLKRAVARRAAHGESFEHFAMTAAIRRLIEQEQDRYGGGPKLNPRERAAKGLPKKTNLSRKMKKVASKVWR